MSTDPSTTSSADPGSVCLRQEMLTDGFSLLEVPPFLARQIRLLPRQRLVLDPGSRRWWRLPALARYVCLLEDRLSAALPEETPALASLELRPEPAGFEDPAVDRLHADGSYLRSVFTPVGEPTLYRADKVDRAVPEGQTLLMTALDRARALHVPCTLHRRPGAGPERLTLVGSFEPRPESARLATVHRDVVEQDAQSRNVTVRCTASRRRRR